MWCTSLDPEVRQCWYGYERNAEGGEEEEEEEGEEIKRERA
jgi:hypothetical protein